MAELNRSSEVPLHFAARTSIEQVEEGSELAPKFDEKGFIPCVTTNHTTGELLMVAVMNQEALEKTVLTSVPLAQGSDKWSCPESCRDAY